MKTYKKYEVYETIIANIVKKEVRELMRGLEDLSVYKVDVSLKPLTVACYIEFEACFTIKEKRWSLTGLVDRYGKVSYGDLICDDKLIYRFY